MSPSKKYGYTLNAIEKKHFAPINSFLRWIGTAASPFCSFYASYLQYKAPETTFSHLVEQINVVNKLRRLGTRICYPRSDDKKTYELTVLAFPDARKGSELSQLGVIIGLLIGEFKSGSIYHSISWLSYKSMLPTKRTTAAEILSAPEAIEEAKIITHSYKQMLQVNVNVQVCVDSKDLFTSLSTQPNSIDRSIRSDVALIRYEFQVGSVHKVTWIPGKLNLADVLTKPDSPPTEVLIPEDYK